MEVIDIPYDRLCQWLSERNKIPKDWATRIAAIQGRVNAELGALPPLPNLQEFINANFVGFHEVHNIVEIMIKDEQSRGQTVKSMFGRFNNPQIRLWDNLRSEYRKNNLYLAEVGQRLLQAVKYDIPALQSEFKSMVKSIDDHNRQANDKEKHALLAKEKYEKLCQRYEIDPSLPPKPQIGSQIAKLQILYQEILDQLKKSVVQECLTFFTEFLQFSYSADGKIDKQQHDSEISTLASLRRFVKMESAVTAAEAVQLSMGCSSESILPNEVVEIKWDDSQTSDASQWDICCVDGEESSEPAATPNKEQCSLLDTSFRNSVRTDLVELQFFLMHRCAELSADTSLDVFEGNIEGSLLPYFVGDRFWAERALHHITHVQSLIDSEQVQMLQKIHASSSYLNRLVASFDVPRALEKKCMEKSAGLRHRAEELRENTRQLQDQIKEERELIRFLKTQAETELGSLYPGKSIKLIGEIGTILR